MIDNYQIKYRSNISISSATFITLSTCCVFYPYMLSGLVFLVIGLYITFSKQTQHLIFTHKGSGALRIFLCLSIAFPILYRNWLGLIVALAMSLGFIFSLYLRTIMTRVLYERCLSLICFLSVSGTIFGLLETITRSIRLQQFSGKRVSAQFFYPNYFGTIAATAIIICAYKILTKQGKQICYYLIIAANIVSLYLCKSMFAFAEVFIGVLVLLVILKHYKLLFTWLLLAVIICMLILGSGIALIPRLGDASVTFGMRLPVWKLTLEQIMHSPFIGHGYMSFTDVYHNIYSINAMPHSHSILLDLLINFGFIGTGFFAYYYFHFFKSVFVSCFQEKQTQINSVILAVAAAGFVHGLTDLTLLWIQTLPLFFLILSGYGAIEKEDYYA